MKVKEYFKILQILFYAFLGGQLFFALIIISLAFSGSLQAAIKTDDIYYFIILIIVAATYYGGNILYKKMMQKIWNTNELHKKFDQMRIAFLIKFALLESASFISLVFFMLTFNYMFLIIALMVIFLFSLSKLNKNKIAEDMQLSESEKKLLQDDNAIISSKF